jgi:hypothetical protein
MTEKTSVTESAQETLGGIKKKFSIIKGAQTKLGGMKKNPKDPKILSKNKKKKQFDDAQNHMKKTKTKKKLKPNTKGAR